MTSSQLVFDGQTFVIRTARLSANLDDPVWCDMWNHGKQKELRWGIEIEAEAADVDGELIAPAVNIDDLAISPRSWRELSGVVSQWNTSIRPDTDDRYGMTYVWAHSLISSCKVEIGERQGTLFNVRLVGQNEDQEQFEIVAAVHFIGVSVRFSGADTATTVAERLARHTDITNLVPSPFRSTGAHCNAGYVVFTPVENTA